MFSPLRTLTGVLVRLYPPCRSLPMVEFPARPRGYCRAGASGRTGGGTGKQHATTTGTTGRLASNAGRVRTRSVGAASIVSLVNDTTRNVGGHWRVYSEPTAESCTEAADDGLTYTYILMQDGPRTDPAKAVAAVEQLWKGQGITTERYRTGAADPILGVRGRGGPATSMDFLADARRFSVVSVSECAEGSAVEERRRQSTSSPTP